MALIMVIRIRRVFLDTCILTRVRGIIFVNVGFSFFSGNFTVSTGVRAMASDATTGCLGAIRCIAISGHAA